MKKLITLLILAIIGIQFIPVERTNPPVVSDIDAPPHIKEILKKACYDCHSNETEWAWYTKIAPMSFLTVKDVDEGREHLNFSDWGKFSSKADKVKEEIWEEVREEHMPPWMYRVVHSSAKLSLEEKDALREWATY
jgi:hypothetical protein